MTIVRQYGSDHSLDQYIKTFYLILHEIAKDRNNITILTN
jgi:hypothetical protein